MRTHLSAPIMTAKRRWAATLVLSASLIVLSMDMTILTIALPHIAEELQPSANQQLWIVDIYTLVLAGLLVTWAAIGDRWGRKRMLMLGYAIFVIASLLVLYANTAETVIAIRAFLGIGGAMIMPTTLSLIRVIFTDPVERAKALGIWAGMSGLGAAIGPLVGGALLQYFSWHSAFLINVPLMLAAIIAAAWLLPESRVSHSTPLDLLSAVLSLIGMISLVWAIKEFSKENSFNVPLAWASIALAAITLSWFAFKQFTTEKPLLDLRLFKSRSFSGGIIAAFSATLSLVAGLVLLVQWLQIVHGASPVKTGVFLVPVAIASAISSVLAPVLAERIGARAVLASGLALAGIGLTFLAVTTVTITVVLSGLVLVGLGTGALAVGSAMIMSSTPEEKAGNAGALEETAYELGSTLGVAILGSIAALYYRENLQTLSNHHAEIAAAPTELINQASESLGAAAHLSQSLGFPQLGEIANEAFTTAVQNTGLIGGIMMLGFAVGVYLLTPKNTDITGGH